ncbi:hypothetical protein [Gracilinema caldarium]|uniref:Lipoprotein n=1 Tax=Gracilinema caldarium (strain ATCC 51460 / DSM 7334 / H1) TaxID=744872 RepID=F8F0G0_GRAC1|nr:hypothetical protein [Gracilinema caldarium]AEJ19304.1 hypothetical protein Spica_1158 [Gracilinema caldarium DSM 7334]
MVKGLTKFFLFLFATLIVILSGCAVETETANIPFIDQAGKTYVLNTTKKGKQGLFREGSRFLYKLDNPLNSGTDQALLVTYRVYFDVTGTTSSTIVFKGAPTSETIDSGTENDRTLLVSLLRDSKKSEEGLVWWQLPLSPAFLGFTLRESSALPESPRITKTRTNHKILYRMRYSIPLSRQSISGILIDYKKTTGNSGSPVVIQLEELRLEPLWFGFSLQEGTLACTPFVSYKSESYSINIPEEYGGTGPWQLDLLADAPLGSPVMLHLGTPGKGGMGILSSTIHPLVAGSLPALPFPVSLIANNPYRAFIIRPYNIPPFPGDPDHKVQTAQVAPTTPANSAIQVVTANLSSTGPIPADPASILEYRQELWRKPDYEVFQWDRFPRILIFDTRSYEVQDRLFKRLAFYVEKAGFRGRLSSDEEIASLHGWNAHDYCSKDLAAFFTAAEKTKFALNKEELQLRNILLAHGIIKAGIEEGKQIFVPGEGAIISISRESEAYLRRLFMVHEAFHGLFFIDADFQNFALDRWNHLNPVARKFLVAYFKNRGYDTADSYLMKNELMAYCLQQSVAGAALYFGKTLPERLSAFSNHRSSLPEKDEKSGTWPALAALFTEEARAFSDYVTKRWGLEAGRVWDIRKNPL